MGFTDDGKPVLDDRVMREALVAAAGIGVPVSQHAEDTRLTGGCSMNAGPVAFRLGLRGMTVEAEARIVERDIRLLRISSGTMGCGRICMCSMCRRRGRWLIRGAKAAGLHVTCEVAPHHFTLTDENFTDCCRDRLFGNGTISPRGLFSRLRWSGHAQRRDCRYALQLYAERPGTSPVSIRNVRANYNCPPRRGAGVELAAPARL